MASPTASKRRAFWKVDGGGKYHRDRQCYFLRRAINAGREQRFLAADPGLGKTMHEPYVLDHCSRCGV